ncbi:MAG: VOC family protein [Salibacteraceae bacterium]
MKVNLIVIRTDQPKALSEFYQALGMDFECHQHGNGPLHYSTEINGTVFEIYPLMKHQEEPDRSLRLGFALDHLDEKIEQLRSHGVEVVMGPKHSEWGYMAIIKDLDGRKIELKEEKGHSIISQ